MSVETRGFGPRGEFVHTPCDECSTNADTYFYWADKRYRLCSYHKGRFEVADPSRKYVLEYLVNVPAEDE